MEGISLSLLEKTRNVFKKKNKNRHEFWYLDYYKRTKIKKKSVLLESTHGKAFNSHLYYLAEELLKNNALEVNIVSREPDVTKEFLLSKGFKGFKVVKHLSKEYCKLLASCEYLINDTTFWPFFNKKDSQKYYNIWHGTPLKCMGKDMEVMVDVANVQRNFYMADRIIFSNEYTKDVMIDSHNLRGIYPGEIAVAPSPRNAVLHDVNKRNKIKEKYAPNGEKIIIYMPTWRGDVGRVENNDQKLVSDLIHISSGIDQNTKVFVKLHPFQKSHNVTNIPNIYQFPEEEELYEFLSGVDVLITDYSSIMYDFLNTERKIILYAYDKEEYYETRGVYEDIENYPLTLVDNIQALIREMNRSKMNDYSEMVNRFCDKDNIMGVKQVVDYLIHDKTDNVDVYNIHNGKETVAILSGGFWDNGITTALINTLENIDTSKRNYLVFFGKNKLQRQHYFRVKNLPENVLFYPVPGQMNGNLIERFVNKRYLFTEAFDYPIVERLLNRLYKKKLYNIEFKRIFGDLKVDYFVHYTGFERKYAEMTKHIPSKTILFVHTDMFQEYKAKKNFSKRVVFGAYQNAYRVVLVNENLKHELEERLPSIKTKIKVVNNFLGEKKVINLASEDLVSTMREVHVDYADSQGFYDTIELAINEQKNKFKDQQISFDQKIEQLMREKGNVEDQHLLKQFNKMLNSTLKVEFDQKLDIEFYESIFSVNPSWLEDVFDELNIDFNKSKYRKLKNAYLRVMEKQLKINYINQLLPFVSEDLSRFSMLVEQDSEELNLKYILKKIKIDKLRLINHLLDPQHKVFINIGRYDYQKGHERLIRSFEQLYLLNNNISLVIVAPHGALKNQTLELARQSIAKSNIFILGRMSNPYPLLKASDAFVLSSHYEGLGLVAFEALAAGTDLITVNLKETVRNLEPNNAIVVENSSRGIYNGMKIYLQEDKTFTSFDFDKQNQVSMREFEGIF
jgi:CDP-glycerol glycerophosphotransferase (TagB/SpsB family)